MYTGKDNKGRHVVAEVTHPKFDDFKTPKMGGVRKNRTLLDMAVKGEGPSISVFHGHSLVCIMKLCFHKSVT